MLKAIKDFFDLNMAGGASASAPSADHALRLATAALLAETARIDRDIQPQEREAALQAVREKFGLDRDEADTLLQLAAQEVAQAGGYYQFTSLINRRFSQEQKERMLELMWRIAYADQVLSADELHLMRKIAALLHIPDSAYIAAKMRARDAAPPAEGN